MKPSPLLNSADLLFEEGNFSQAKLEYLKNQQFAQAAFSALLDESIDEAIELYQNAPHSSAKRWGLFLCDFFTDPDRAIPSPGVLSFRLYFEVTFSYCYRFKKLNYIEKFLANANALQLLYPEYLNDLDRVHKTMNPEGS